MRLYSMYAVYYKLCSLFLFLVTAAAAVGLVSCDCGILSAYISSRLSHTWSMALGVFLTVASYLLLWSFTFFTDFYQHNVWLLILYYAIAGKKLL